MVACDERVTKGLHTINSGENVQSVSAINKDAFCFPLLLLCLFLFFSRKERGGMNIRVYGGRERQR